MTEAEADTEADVEAEQIQKQKQKQKAVARPRDAATAAQPEPSATAATPDPYPDNPVMPVLKEFGIAINKTTRPLLDYDAAYVEAHLLAAARREEKPGLAIRRILDGDEVPRRPGERSAKQYIPPELADVINR